MDASSALRLWPSIAASQRDAGAVYKILLSVTQRCPLRCTTCHIWEQPVRDELDPSEIDRLLTRLPSLRWLALTGGEVAARPDWSEVAEVVRRHAPRLLFLSFPTNGYLTDATVELARRLVHPNGPRPVVTVSIDGPPALHDRLRGRSGAFERAVETARRLARDPSVETYVGTTLGVENVGLVDEIYATLREHLPELMPDRWHTNVMMHAPRFYGQVDEAEPDTEAVLAATRRIERLRGVPLTPFAATETLFLRTLRYRLKTGRSPVPCQALAASVHVSATGVVSPCHVRGPELGNVRDVDYELARLLTTPEARAVRAEITTEPCARCWSPCEAYHAIVASPLTTLARALSPAAR